MRNTTHTPVWTPDHEAALDGLLAAWVRDDDLRRSRTATFADRHASLVELQTARQAVRDARRRSAEQVLVA